jgi:uncharacterized protein DUF6328
VADKRAAAPQGPQRRSALGLVSPQCADGLVDAPLPGSRGLGGRDVQDVALLLAVGRNVYVLAFMLCATATALLIAPVAFHRVVYRRRLKQHLVQVANRLALSGLVLLLLAMIAALLADARDPPAGRVGTAHPLRIKYPVPAN